MAARQWWEIDLPEIGTRSAARKLSDVQHMAEEAAAVWLNVDPEELDVYTYVEAARMLGLSMQRVHQLAGGRKAP